MDEKKRMAKRLRDVYIGKLPDSELERIADEIDPPTVHPIVWWRFCDPVSRSRWRLGSVDVSNKGVHTSDGLIYWPRIEWKYARILGPRQIAVDLPPVNEWPKRAEEIEISMEFWPYNSTKTEAWTENFVPRAVAESIENDG